MAIFNSYVTNYQRVIYNQPELRGGGWAIAESLVAGFTHSQLKHEPQICTVP
jgi:hypothetical protein